MAATNDITGDKLVSKKTEESYRDGWDRIFGKKEKVEETENEEVRDSEESNA